MNTFYMLVGLPGSGKTSEAKKLCSAFPNVKHLSSDMLREEMFGDINVQTHNNEVFAEMNERAINYLNEGYNVLYDATNVNRKSRKRILSILPKDIEKVCYIIWAPYEECIARDESRERKVGKRVIDKFLYTFQPPYEDEGFDFVDVIYNTSYDPVEYSNKVLDSMKIPHDNPHHKDDTILDHCMRVSKELINSIIYKVGLYHDCGKPLCKQFKDSKGNETKEAHYYNHENVSAYISYGIPAISCRDAYLIGNHMRLYRDRDRFFDTINAYDYEDLKMLNNADIRGS